MKLELFEYSVQLISYTPPGSNNADAIACAVIQVSHPDGQSYVFRAYPNSSGWNNPSVLSHDVLLAIQASKPKEAEKLRLLLVGLFNLHSKSLIQKGQV